MTDESPTDPLHEWNKLARENTENAIVSSMFEAGAKSAEPVVQFSTWLLVATGAIASVVITNADKLLPLTSKQGFLVCGTFLCFSCAAGIFTKMYAVRIQRAILMQEAMQSAFQTHLEHYWKDEQQIKEGAAIRGITLETGIRMERIDEEFLKPQSKFSAWRIRRHTKKNKERSKLQYAQIVPILTRQEYSAALQAFSFLGFLIAGFIYVAA